VATTILLAWLVITMLVRILATKWYRVARESSKFVYQFETLANVFHYVDILTFRLLFIPTLFHANIGVSCYFEHYWCGDIMVADVAVSWVTFVLGLSMTTFYF
jgi:hypothetical protein